MNVKGESTLSTSNGRVFVDGCESVNSIETSNGSVEVRRTKVIGDVKTSNGKIEVEIENLKENGAKIATSNGSIYVYLNENLNLDIELETSNGKLNIKNLNIKTDILKDTFLRGKLNYGGVFLSIKTSNASIYLDKLIK